MSEGEISTLREVAAQAGVSRATASMALRGDVRIAVETRKRVKAAAEVVGYRADPVLAALSTRRWNRRNAANLAVCVDDEWLTRQSRRRPSWMEDCLDGMKETATQYGYTLTIVKWRRELMTWKDPDRVLQGRGVSGVLVLPFKRDGTKQLSLLNWDSYSVVEVGRVLSPFSWHRAGTDAFASMNLVCEKMLQMHISRVGLVQPLQAEERLRFESLGALAKEWYLSLDRKGLAMVNPCMPAVLDKESFLEWYFQEHPQVIVTATSGVLTWLSEAEVRVPDEVGVVLLNRDFSPHVNAAGVSQHLDEVGRAAIELMHGLVLRGQRGNVERRRELLIYPDWIDGDTLI
ncbi:LacI family DNA-binding transcriptional regulator [Coraliomargarita sp. SDUM461004]|uniref:LacI family DNA-binding transcriptional regulator n=1 Tax=Thalassobacterium sedimentorum TaxID=3041258 RepID=A0ABU1AIZ7_9BACT|nr:LacI family DNA-binding transcriptional regulator [Coraliomargarita sp. SDUM461004]MDQ8194795.1 LacI family DNA-binding transcriptional regulator [Coraliomargarita sp. SDUM461004]